MKLKSYRGIEWTTNTSLSRKLGKHDDYVNLMLRKHPDFTVEYIIDMNLDANPFNRNRANMYPRKQYRGMSWVNDSQLSQLLGFNTNYVKVRMSRDPGLSYRDIIDDVLDSRELEHPNHTKFANEEVGYRGYTWRSYMDLSAQLGRPPYYVGYLLRYHDDWTVEDAIDYILSVNAEEACKMRRECNDVKSKEPLKASTKINIF